MRRDDGTGGDVVMCIHCDFLDVGVKRKNVKKKGNQREKQVGMILVSEEINGSR